MLQELDISRLLTSLRCELRASDNTGDSGDDHHGISGLTHRKGQKGLFRCKREMFSTGSCSTSRWNTSSRGNWIYLAHESQLPKINDYYTTKIGRQPVFITRNKDNQLNCFINACAHRGATLARFKHGNKATYTCPFHGWTFNNSGKLLKIKDPSETGYPEASTAGSHDLKKIARFESLPRLPVRQPEGRRAAAGRLPRRVEEDHRHGRRPVARGPGSAARLLDLRL